MRAYPQEIFIMRLKNKLSQAHPFSQLTVEEALAGLKKLSGQDLGSDPEAWAKWWRAEKKRLNI